MTLEEMLYQQRNVFPALVEARQFDFHNAQAIVEVLPKLAGSHHFGQVTVAGSHDTDIHRSVLVGADASDLLLLNRAKQIDLKAGFRLRNFVKKQRASMCGFKQPGTG